MIQLESLFFAEPSNFTDTGKETSFVNTLMYILEIVQHSQTSKCFFFFFFFVPPPPPPPTLSHFSGAIYYIKFRDNFEMGV